LISLANALRTGVLSAREAVEASLAAAHAAQGRVNAFSVLYDEAARADAAERDAQRARGESLGPLHGVPFAVKDLIHVAGEANTRGSRLHAQSRARETAPVVERLLAAGAVMVGRTTTTEFGWKAASTNPLHGVTRNPRQPALTAGGSSCGSAAAVASGAVTLAIGSDGGGSVRIPASFCGIYALKGTLGRVPAWPWSATEMLSHVGPMTADAADSALAFDVLSGAHWRDPQSLPREGARYQELAAQPLPAGLRVAYAPTLFGAQVDPLVRHVVQAAVRRIATELSLTVEERTPDWPDPFEIFETLWVIGRGIVYGEALQGRLEQVDPGFARLVHSSRDGTAARYLKAMEERAAFNQRVARSFEDVDVWLMPTLPVLPFAAEADGPADWNPDSSPVAWGRWTPFTYPFNVTGQPAASLPCGSTPEGVPVGLQVVTARHHDGLALQFSAAAESVLRAA
jgi:aspartyl-tRNA(Asn)/glutamyl-tRNA(Gln) amidotransferase subunit A